MATNPYVNKVVYSGTILIDISDSTNTASNMLSGTIAYNRSGARITGACTYDADTSDGTTNASELLYGEVAYSGGQRIVGTMPNIGAQNGVITTKAQQISISAGYHDGSGKVQIDSTEQAKIIAENIKKDVVILGVTGTLDDSLDDGRVS